MFSPDLFAGKRILVTGGGTVLGRAMGERFLELGAEVIICGRRGTILEQSAEAMMAAHGGTVIPHTVDIRDAEAVEAMADEIWEHGPLHGLVNNAAGNFIARTKDLSANGFDAIANTVLHGTFYVTNACGKRWIAGGDPGSVISIVATWVWTGSPFVIPSAMSKAGIAAMTKSLAVEWGPHGIRINAIAPGPFPTEGAWATAIADRQDGARLHPERSPRAPRRDHRIGQPGELPARRSVRLYYRRDHPDRRWTVSRRCRYFRPNARSRRPGLA